jgi:hypothetical protein
MRVTSEKKAAAARANGARSRGPITSHGKRRSSRNAIKHGILAKTIVPEGEDLRRFTALVKSYCDRLGLRDESELALVHKLVEASWRLQRLRSFEGHTLACAPIPAEPTPVDRYFATLLRTHSRLLHLLIERAALPRATKIHGPNEPITSSPCNKSTSNEPIIEPITNPLSSPGDNKC